MSAPQYGPVITGAPGGGTASSPNARAAAANNSGNTTLTRTRANMLIDLTVGGVARTSKIILALAGAVAGDVMTVRAALPATADIVLDFRNAAAGGTQLLPAQSFGVAQVLTTDGVILSATIRFSYTGSAWEYLDSSIPA